MQLRTYLAFTVLLGLLTACTGPSISPQDRALLASPARALEARGEWREAADAWQQASQTVAGDIAIELQLNAADALLQQDDGPGATQIVRALPESIAPALSIRRALILADAAIHAGDPTAALQRLGPGLAVADPRVLARYRSIRADALEMSGDALGASRERSLRDSLLGLNEERYRNRQKIWDLLASVPTQQLHTAPPSTATAHHGWVELAVIVRQNVLDVDQLNRAISEWSVRYPGHPAGEEIVLEVIELARIEAQPPSKVAVLLPQTGAFASVAAAIREGFMAAWHADAPNQYRPEIVMMDTNAQDAALAYSDAISDGAQFVVGPLTKESVTTVVENAALSVTTLALNYPLVDALSSDTVAAADSHQDTFQDPNINATPSDASTDTRPIAQVSSAVQPAEQALQETADAGDDGDALSRARNLQRVFYFVLSPENEARRAAEFAFERGARQAAVLSATGTWGDRVGTAFAERWQDLGGLMATHVRYTEEAQGLSEAVEQLLNIKDSKARAKRLRAVLVRNITHEPQPRSDIDVIFMAAFPQAARQIRPLLRFHRAENVPVVSSSHVYAGLADPQADQDLDGVIFADMPWLMNPDVHSLPAQVRSLWPDAAGVLGRLYAFGADAYTLISRLRELRVTANGTYPGLTGKLSLSEQRHVRLDMPWSRFSAGVAQPSATVKPAPVWTVSGR